MNNFDNDGTADILKELSIQDFLNIGVDQVAYIKKSYDMNENQETFTVHAADGSPISVMESYDMAVASVRVNDLFPVTLH